MRYSKHDDIEAVLNKAKQLLDLIVIGYDKALDNQSIPNNLLVEIKDYLGNLKSALDYSAKKFGKDNFPVRATEKDFDCLKFGFSDEVKSTIKSWQPFNNNEWLSWFNTLNNEFKHVTLTPQIRAELKTMTARTQHMSVSMPIDNPNFHVQQGANCHVSIGGIPVKFTDQGIIPLAEGLQTEITVWVNFNFDNSQINDLPSNISALPFLKECFEKIKLIVADLEKYN